MKKTTLLIIISFLVGYYAIPVMAQKVKKKYDLREIQKAHWRDSGLLSYGPDIPLTKQYHPSNSADEVKFLNALISDFQVNENSIMGKIYIEPAVSADISGNFIIAWAEKGDIFAQRFSSDGAAIGNNFKVSDEQDSARRRGPSISADDSGNFIITWMANYDIYAQRYSSDGTALGSNFKVNDDLGSTIQSGPSISAGGSRNFVITWKDERNSTSTGCDIYAQRYASNGTALGSNFKVNDDIDIRGRDYPSISADGSGNFIITWGDLRSGDPEIYAQRYASDGTALKSNFMVTDDIGSGIPHKASISANDSGNFIITWQDERNGNYDIYASDMQAMEQNWGVISKSMMIKLVVINGILPFQQMTVEILSSPGKIHAMVVMATYTLSGMQAMARHWGVISRSMRIKAV